MKFTAKLIATLSWEIGNPNLLCLKKCSFKVESQRSCCPLILMFSMFKTPEVLPANET